MSDTIALYASPEEVRWSDNGEPCEGPEQALLSVEAPLVRVVVSAPDTPDFTVEGLTATPFALPPAARALASCCRQTRSTRSTSPGDPYALGSDGTMEAKLNIPTWRPRGA